MKVGIRHPCLSFSSFNSNASLFMNGVELTFFSELSVFWGSKEAKQNVINASDHRSVLCTGNSLLLLLLLLVVVVLEKPDCLETL